MKKQQVKIIIVANFHVLELRDKKPLEATERLMRVMLDQPHHWRKVELEGIFPIEKGKVILCPMIGKIKAVKTSLSMYLQVHAWRTWSRSSYCKDYMAGLGLSYEVLAKKVSKPIIFEPYKVEGQEALSQLT